MVVACTYSNFADWIYVNESEAVSAISVLSPGHGALQDLVSRGRGALCEMRETLLAHLEEPLLICRKTQMAFLDTKRSLWYAFC